MAGWTTPQQPSGGPPQPVYQPQPTAPPPMQPPVAREKKSPLTIAALGLAVAAMVIALTGMAMFPGPSGAPGAPGQLGAVGPKGDPGDQGIQGQQGFQGQQGIAGTDGTNGTNGTNGISCWDLNQNGVPEVATEDLNNDTVVDVRDCTWQSYRWALVHGDGTIEAQSGGMTAIHGGTGFWFVTFPGADVLSKPVMVSLSRMDGNWPAGVVEATPCGGAPQGVNCFMSNNINTVLVNIADAAGVSTDWAFYILVVG